MATTTTMLDTAQSMPNRRASTRLSTYSITPTLTPSIAPSRLSMAESDPKHSLDYSDYSEFATIECHRAFFVPAARNSPIGPVQEESVTNVQTRLKRMEDARLQSQRFSVSENKQEELSRLALGAKLERALSRRMSGQDAVFTQKKKKAFGEKKL